MYEKKRRTPCFTMCPKQFDNFAYAMHLFKLVKKVNNIVSFIKTFERKKIMFYNVTAQCTVPENSFIILLVERVRI